MLSFLLSISRAIDRVSGWFGAVIAVITMVMILVGVWNVIGRFIGRAVGQNLTSNSFLEWQWYLFSLVFLLGGAYVLRHNEHVRVDVFYARMTPRGRAITNLVGTLLFLIPFCIIMLYVNWQFFYTSWLIREGSPDPGGLPRYPIKFAIVLGFALLLLQAVSELIKSAAILMGRLHEERKDQLELIKAEVVEGP
ncbi:TRAP transporter small permease subunit [Deinococcus peraridilitoris]|uniref:TRAP-type mannitol/chloroaromatic compound transport system, small permease component n=1 Tax=Deinococcus peraridilitoris (strain DSM 19664 / LMG 22246 / CIP 109416 / KR-200) TaxID=937777 RepID=K9ZY94_DEIPD|nr:TRAP transporter small permease subunit [Deinococcus peraridilitoris]AFZ66154.1 TRAP-type mannitol/chloroaromatic compound transport system, small permease component [Deinococcus peraridilitoris DSM 19664]